MAHTMPTPGRRNVVLSVFIFIFLTNNIACCKADQESPQHVASILTSILNSGINSHIQRTQHLSVLRG